MAHTTSGLICDCFPISSLLSASTQGLIIKVCTLQTCLHVAKMVRWKSNPCFGRVI